MFNVESTAQCVISRAKGTFFCENEKIPPET